jgi:AcrR family transcriptional regulator
LPVSIYLQSHPALYLVFPGKEEIFSAVIEWASERSLKAIREGLKNEWALEKKLLYTLELSIGQGYDTIKAHPDAEDLLSFNHKSPAIQAGSAKLQGYLAELLREAVKGSSLAATSEELARTLLASMRGFKPVGF